MTTIGERIRKLRIESGLTQKQLGERAKIAEPTIRKYELGKLNPKIETIQKIANALKVPIQLITEPKEFFTFMETDTHFIDLLRKKCSDEIEDFKRLSEEEQDCLFAGLFLDLERKYIDGDDSFFSDNELSKMNYSTVESYMKEMNKAGQAVLVQTAKTLSEMPEYQKDPKK